MSSPMSLNFSVSLIRSSAAGGGGERCGAAGPGWLAAAQDACVNTGAAPCFATLQEVVRGFFMPRASNDDLMYNVGRSLWLDIISRFYYYGFSRSLSKMHNEDDSDARADSMTMVLISRIS